MKFSVLFIQAGLVWSLVSCAPSLPALEYHYNTSEWISDSTTNVPVWDDFYQDPFLKVYISEALEHNLELLHNQQNLILSEQRTEALSGAYLPFLSVVGASDVEKVGEFTRSGAVEHQLTLDGKEFPEPLGQQQVLLMASWEFDIWQKLRNEKRGAQQEFLASVEGQHGLQTAVVAEVAGTYYEILAWDNLRELIQQNIELQGAALRTVRLQKEAGETTELAVKRFEAELLKNESALFEVNQRLTELERSLNVLMGRSQGEIKRQDLSWMQWASDSSGNASLRGSLWDRPDVKRAEFELAAAKFDVRAARAEFLPEFSLRAHLGLEAFKPDYLTQIPQSLAYGLAGDLVGPLINKKAIRAHFKYANARQIQALIEYERTLLVAQNEIQNERSKRKNLMQAYALKAEQVAAMNASIDIANKLFFNARADYMEVLFTQREALEARKELVELQLELVTNKIMLYKKLGGGWK